jgi:hypothetical protein
MGCEFSKMNLSSRLSKEIKDKCITFDFIRDSLLRNQKNITAPLYPSPFSSFKAYIVLEENERFRVYASLDSLFTFPIGPVVIFKKVKTPEGVQVIVEIQESKFYLVIMSLLNLSGGCFSFIRSTSFLNIFMVLAVINLVLFFQYLFFKFKAKSLIRRELALIGLNF